MPPNFIVYPIGLRLVVSASLASLLLAGCIPSRYRKSADKEVYKILGGRSESVLGTRLDSSIDTDFSSRKPSDVSGSEIILDRNKSAQDNVLPLKETLALAIKANRSYQFNREKLYLQALSLTGTRHQFAFKFDSSSADFGYARDTTGAVSKESDADATISKLFKTGGALTASLANDLVLYFDGEPKAPSLALSLSQPLCVHGFPGSLSALPYRIAVGLATARTTIVTMTMMPTASRTWRASAAIVVSRSAAPG